MVTKESFDRVMKDYSERLVETVNDLRAFDVFQEAMMGEQELQKFALHFRRHKIAAGAQMITQGKPCENVHFLVRCGISPPSPTCLSDMDGTIIIVIISLFLCVCLRVCLFCLSIVLVVASNRGSCEITYEYLNPALLTKGTRTSKLVTKVTLS